MQGISQETQFKHCSHDRPIPRRTPSAQSTNLAFRPQCTPRRLFSRECSPSGLWLSPTYVPKSSSTLHSSTTNPSHRVRLSRLWAEHLLANRSRCYTRCRDSSFPLNRPRHANKRCRPHQPRTTSHAIHQRQHRHIPHHPCRPVSRHVCGYVDIPCLDNTTSTARIQSTHARLIIHVSSQTARLILHQRCLATITLTFSGLSRRAAVDAVEDCG